LFCENGVVGLPTLTSVSALNAKAGMAVVTTSSRTSIIPKLRTPRETYIFAPFNILLKYRKRIEVTVNELACDLLFLPVYHLLSVKG
jgi:hypothetical protein